MAQLRNLGTPFGSPGGIINVPAPAGSQLAGQIQMQSLQGLGQALGMYFGQRKAGQLRQEDIRRLQAMGPQQDILNTMYGARGMMAPQAQLPQMVSPMGQELALQGQLQNIFGNNYGKPPWWVQGATTEQIEDYRNRVGGPLVQIGERLLSPEQRQEAADTDFTDKVGLSASEKNLARKSAEEILKGAKKRFWHWGTEDYPKNRMIELYKTWRIENTYPDKTPRQRKALDSIWDGLMGLWKKRGHRFDKDTILGKGEIEWDPKDSDIVNIRKSPETKPVSQGSPLEGTLIAHSTELEGGAISPSIKTDTPDELARRAYDLSRAQAKTNIFDRYPAPKTEAEFKNTLKGITDGLRPENKIPYFETMLNKLAKTNPSLAKTLYDKYSDEIYK